MDQRLNFITLGVANVAASRAFYERLGWNASSVGGDGVAFFQAGCLIFALYGKADLAKDACVANDGGGFSGISLAYNVREREDVGKVLEEALKAGARILKPAQDAFWGGHHGYFADLDGYAWEVAWNPGFEMTADGAVIAPK